MRIASLGSGSKGNGTLVDDGETCVLVDLGFTLKETQRRLARLGVEPTDITGVIVTHEHADHIHGVAAFARKFKVPVYLSHGSYQEKYMGAVPTLHKINCQQNFQINTIEVVPVIVPHDAREPCQYLLRSGGKTVGILTDLGHITPHVEAQYRECDALLLECNHDPGMLRDGPYPYPLKVRVGGDYGHLNNDQAAGLLATVNMERLNHLVISHISEPNNLPALAEQAVAPYLEGGCGRLTVASQEDGFDWISLS